MKQPKYFISCPVKSSFDGYLPYLSRYMYHRPGQPSQICYRTSWYEKILLNILFIAVTFSLQARAEYIPERAPLFYPIYFILHQYIVQVTHSRCINLFIAIAQLLITLIFCNAEMDATSRKISGKSLSWIYLLKSLKTLPSSECELLPRRK